MPMFCYLYCSFLFNGLGVLLGPLRTHRSPMVSVAKDVVALLPNALLGRGLHGTFLAPCGARIIVNMIMIASNLGNISTMNSTLYAGGAGVDSRREATGEGQWTLSCLRPNKDATICGVGEILCRFVAAYSCPQSYAYLPPLSTRCDWLWLTVV